MTITESKLTLNPDGEDFVLIRKAEDGTITSIKLTETDVLTLAQSAPNLQQQVLSRHAPRGDSHSAVSVMPVSQAELHDEAMGESILLVLHSPGGSRVTYALPPQLAELLVQRLPVFLARLSAGKPTKQ